MNLLKWFYDLKTIHKMAVLLTVVGIALLTVGWVGLYYTSQITNSMESMYKDRLIPVRYLNICRSNANAIRSDLFELTLSDSKSEFNHIMDDINKRRKDTNEKLEIYKRTKLLPYEKEHIKKLDEVLIEYRAVQAKVINLTENGQNQKALSYLKANDKALKDYQAELRNLGTFNANTAEKEYKKAQKDAALARNISIITILLSSAFSIWLGILTALRIQNTLGGLGEKLIAVSKGDLTISNIGRPDNSCIGDLCVVFDTMLNNLQELVKQVALSAEEVSANSEELSSSAEQTAQGAQQVAQSVSQLAAGTQQVAGSVTELSKGANQVYNSVTQLAQGTNEISKSVEAGANNINKINKAIQHVSSEAVIVSKLGNETELSANEGKQHVVNAVTKIGTIKTVSEEISTTIGELGDLSKAIEEIVDLIKGIAGQTNLLALNAAIEAARAGEHGKGFAVVADEVKKLAGESANATEKITKMIKEIQSKTGLAVTNMERATIQVEEGVTVVNNAGEALTIIIDQVKQANNKIQTITVEIEDISKNSEDVVKMIENISTITEETAASASEIATITNQTASQAGEIASVTEETSASTEEIASISEEQTASLDDISSSSQSLAKIAETLNAQIAIFKV